MGKLNKKLYKVSFEYETEVEAKNEEDAILQAVEMFDFEYIGSEAIAEELKGEALRGHSS